MKMGLIRSGNTPLTPFDDAELTEYLWPILREIIKTAIENSQNLIIEGCYIPFDWKDSFTQRYLSQIRATWLIMSENYINTHFEQILAHANDIEQRLDPDGCTAQYLIEENQRNLENCKKFGCDYILIDDEYKTGEILCLM